jgi:uncharacterized protein YlzI (FlbEa/FlbD family)
MTTMTLGGGKFFIIKKILAKKNKIINYKKKGSL